jgi:hypothetical protein
MSQNVSLAGLAKYAFEGAVATDASGRFQKLFEGDVSVDLSTEAYTKIGDIFNQVLGPTNSQNQKVKTKAILQRLHEATRGSVVDLKALQVDALDNLKQITSYGYRGTDAYLAAAGQALLVYRLIYDRANEPDKVEAANNIVKLAKQILDDLLSFESSLFQAGYNDNERLDVFTAFKCYTFGEHSYDEADSSTPLSYMGKYYRENVQRVLATLEKFDKTKTELLKIKHPRYLLNFFKYEAIQDRVSLLWDSQNCRREADITDIIHGDIVGNLIARDPAPAPAKFWRCYPVKQPLGDYYPLGDLCLTPKTFEGGTTEPTLIPYIRAVEGRLSMPKDYTRIYRDHGTRNPNELSVWNPVPPDGFAMMGSVLSPSQDERPQDRCQMLPVEDVRMTQLGWCTWHDKNTGASENDGSTWSHPAKMYARAGLFVMEPRAHNDSFLTEWFTGKNVDTHTRPDIMIGHLRPETLEGHPYLISTPGPPDFDSDKWTSEAGYLTTGRWYPGYKVRYRVAFYSPEGTLLGPWWRPKGADTEGFYTSNKSRPTLINISVDPKEKATGRIIYRQFSGRDPEAVGVIKNNTDTTFEDKVDEPRYGPPMTAPDFDPSNWSGPDRPGTNHWVEGYKVRYAVSLYGTDGETPMGPWWHPTQWPGADADGFLSERWACPMLTNIPIDRSNTATGRRIYRQFFGGPVELVIDIPDNITTSKGDLNP